MFSQIKKITKMAKKEVINKVITSLFIYKESAFSASK